MLCLNNISKQYRTGELIQQALDSVSLHLRDNEFVSILGPSGSGKTTLLNIIVKLRDGQITEDSNPYTPDRNAPSQEQNMGQAKMSFLTSLSLSFNNLRTKKGRTILTAFPACWSVQTADTTCISTSIRAILKSSISTAPTTKATEVLAALPTMFAWTFLNRWCWARSAA